MKKMGLSAILVCGALFAGPLGFESGSIKAHTEVFGDSTIDPMAKKATSHLSMDAAATTLKGSVEVSMSDLFSDNKKRDEHMQEALESSVFPKAVFDIKEVVAKGGDAYTLKGTMNLHGVAKPISFEGTIIEEGEKVHLKASSALKMSDFGIKPIKLMFLTVRDQVDLNVDMTLKR
ncbi:MAG: YceI family protein [Sulfuricurvum sp.]|uniref:YceI family protein n=1 Tax=Sulfuricurvum sp. TaxID=2025608 RepID=UPI0026385DAB|nr:YceI family protein [Sulfuricurvum sp.]MDD2838315.1 YceI family protein [Sulfuricurvum sp.]MDD3595369.1 YceI family protein [Sulfuricurvum sp.]MDD4882967.1 YceI family protein [Sulfuricurvum sp.]